MREIKVVLIGGPYEGECIFRNDDDENPIGSWIGFSRPDIPATYRKTGYRTYKWFRDQPEPKPLTKIAIT